MPALKIDALRGPVTFDDMRNPVQNIYIKKVEKKKMFGYDKDELWNIVIKTYPNVSQFGPTARKSSSSSRSTAATSRPANSANSGPDALPQGRDFSILWRMPRWECQPLYLPSKSDIDRQ